jgi:23S rRNA (uracil747-C5)-methyltransferase
MSLHCPDFEAGRCASCPQIRVDYAAQLAARQADARRQLPMVDASLWRAPQASAPAGFRNKAKMAAAGSIDAPILGLADLGRPAVDLSDCLLYPESLRAAFAPIKDFIRAARIEPYDIARRRGELKFVLATIDVASGALMLRFVLRSREPLDRMRLALPGLQAALPRLAVTTANLQPLPAAIVEGPDEIHLHGGHTLPMRLNGITLQLRPGGFFQTNTDVAAALYRQVADWVAASGASQIWDLYCGIGGFALHCAAAGREVLGVESSAHAVDGARAAAGQLGVDARFEVADADALRFDGHDAPELVIVNPPRRGLGAALCGQIETADFRWLVYSSCNPASLARDLERMPSLRPVQARLFDMFPHTGHAEVAVWLARSEGGLASRHTAS